MRFKKIPKDKTFLIDKWEPLWGYKEPTTYLYILLEIWYKNHIVCISNAN